MNDKQALELSKEIRETVERWGAKYCSGSYGNIHDKPGDPLRFQMNFLSGGEKFNIELTDNDFALGPFVDPTDLGKDQ